MLGPLSIAWLLTGTCLFDDGKVALAVLLTQQIPI